MQLSKVDPNTGMWEADVILDYLPCAADGTPDPAYITVPVPPDAGFWHARWNGEAWEEGGTALEPVTPEPTPEQRLAAVEAQSIEQADAIATIYEMMLGGGLGA